MGPGKEAVLQVVWGDAQTALNDPGHVDGNLLSVWYSLALPSKSKRRLNLVITGL